VASVLIIEKIVMKPEKISQLKELTPEYLHARLTKINKKIHELRLESQQIRVIIKTLKK
jgi:hypothetical protein